MAFQVSPGVLVQEKDLTNVVPAVATSIGAIAIQSTQGPLDEVVTVGSEKELVEQFPWLDATIGGEISIDIYERGSDKGQILDDLNGEKFTFFGDNLFPGGNDYAIQEAAIEKKLKGNEFHHVKSWKDTRNLLYSIMTEVVT